MHLIKEQEFEDKSWLHCKYGNPERFKKLFACFLGFFKADKNGRFQ